MSEFGESLFGTVSFGPGVSISSFLSEASFPHAVEQESVLLLTYSLRLCRLPCLESPSEGKTKQ